MKRNRLDLPTKRAAVERESRVRGGRGRWRHAGADRPAVRQAAAAVRAGRAAVDDVFDQFLPPALREVSPHYWTPIAVARRAAAWLRECRVRTVTDVGSGAGKFCVVAALLSRCRIVGLEHRASLVHAARDLASTFEVDHRVSFVHGTIDDLADVPGDAYYLFNPFGDYVFPSARFFDPDVAGTAEAQQRDAEAVTAFLSGAPRGTFVLTYNGYGAPLPPGYEQIDVARHLPGTLRLWKKQGARPRGNRVSSAAIISAR